jgi:phospholipid transport system substrate-binding protein
MHQENWMKPHLPTLLALFLTLSVNSGAAAGQPTNSLKSNFQKLKLLLKKPEANRVKIDKRLDILLDFNHICQTTLAKHWDSVKDNQRTDFCDALKVVIKKKQVERLSTSKVTKTTYDDEKVEDITATVYTTNYAGKKNRQEKTEVIYKLHKKDGAWRAIDLIMDGTSLVEKYQSSFNKVIRKRGWDALLKKIQKMAR